MATSKKRSKPSKPSPAYPLFPHDNGQWCKKIKGKAHYFGKWEDSQEALEKYLAEKDYILAGVAKPTQGGHTVLEVCDRFLVARAADVETGELSARTYKDYTKNCQLISDIAGEWTMESMTPENWRELRSGLAKGVGTTTLGNRVRQARVALRFFEEISGEPIRFGKGFREPSAKAKRQARSEAGDRTHTAAEILGAIKATRSPQMKAMILLGINCALGNEDCGRLTWDKVDLDGGWHSFGRPKTYIPRRAKLWGRTVQSLKVLQENSTSELVFLTKYGNPWSSTSIAHEALKLGLTFYNLRRTFRTIADSTLETMAIRMVMGHASADRDMDARYIQRIGDERLKLVADFVEAWLDS